MDANEPCSTQLKAQKDESEVPVQCDCLPPAAAATAATAVGAADLTSLTRVNGWNKDEKMRRFYYAKFPSYEDRNLKAKIDEAKREIKKLNEARGPIAESLMLEKMDQERLRGQLQCLKLWTSGDRQRCSRDELVLLRQCLSKLRCSPSSEWTKQIRRSSHRLIHGSKSLREERQILRELRQLESRNEQTGVENDEEKEWIQQRFGSMEDIQLSIESIRNGMKEQTEWERAKRSELKRLAGEKAAIDQRVLELRGELFHINQGKAMAYNLILESQKQQDQLAADYTDFITLMNNADELAHKKDVAALKVSSHMQVERFMYRWNSDKGYRDEYMRKTQPTLYSRGLGADGRIRNPAEEEERLALELGTPPLRNQQTPPKAKFKWGMDSRKSQ